MFGKVVLMFSDNISLFTTQATLHKNMANIASQLSGVITQVNVGDTLLALMIFTPH